MKLEARTLKFWLPIIVTSILSIAAINVSYQGNDIAEGANTIAEGSKEVAEEANTIAKESKEIAEEANTIAQADIKPMLTAECFFSYSVDMRSEEDLSRIVRDDVTVVVPPQERRDIEAGRRYAWLLMRNEGLGPARIFSIEVPFHLPPEEPRIKRFEWDDGRPISPGKLLALYLGYFTSDLTFVDQIEVHYKTALEEEMLIIKRFSPSGIYEHMMDVHTMDVPIVEEAWE